MLTMSSNAYFVFAYEYQISSFRPIFPQQNHLQSWVDAKINDAALEPKESGRKNLDQDAPLVCGSLYYLLKENWFQTLDSVNVS